MKSYKGRHFLVRDKYTGIPYRNQDYMTVQECVDWINHDVSECHKCGLKEITDRDYEIVDSRDWEVIL